MAAKSATAAGPSGGGGAAAGAGGGGIVLKPEALQLVLAEATSENVFSCMLLSTSGQLISCAGERMGEDLVSAIVASVWKTYERGDPSSALQSIFVDCEEGVLACSLVLPNWIICLVADRAAPLGMLKIKLDALRAHLAGPLAPVFAFQQAQQR